MRKIIAHCSKHWITAHIVIFTPTAGFSTLAMFYPGVWPIVFWAGFLGVVATIFHGLDG